MRYKNLKKPTKTYKGSLLDNSHLEFFPRELAFCDQEASRWKEIEALYPLSDEMVRVVGSSAKALPSRTHIIVTLLVVGIWTGIARLRQTERITYVY
jgi:hypothetical protein